jgi:CDP-diacylglycerol--glycerol-3-phosphate 3-phosphatidyltransferase
VISPSQILIAFRAACAPAIFVLACFDFPGPVLAGVLLAAFVSDVFDGVAARRRRNATPELRLADTIVDTIFYVAAAIGLKIAVPDAYRGLWLPLVLLIVVHVSRSTFELTKYGRIASYHMWSARFLGVLLVAAFGYAFAAGRPTVLLECAMWVGIANEIEGFAASVLLPDWRADVPSVVHAYRWRACAPSELLRAE